MNIPNPSQTLQALKRETPARSVDDSMRALGDVSLAHIDLTTVGRIQSQDRSPKGRSGDAETTPVSQVAADLDAGVSRR